MGQVSVKTVDFGESEYTEATSFKTSSLSDSDKSEVDKLVDTVNENKDSLQKLITDVKDSLKAENANIKSDIKKRVPKSEYNYQMGTIQQMMGNLELEKHSCSWTGYQNDWDKELTYTVPSNSMINGVSSVH